MRRSRTSWGMGAMASGLVAVATAACTTEGPPRSQLVLAFQSDLKLPDDISQVLLSVESRGEMLFAQSFPVGPSGVKLPATLTLHDPADGVKPVTIRLVGLSPRNEARTLKETQTTIPAKRTALLRVPVEFLCLDDRSLANADELAAVATEPARVVNRLARSACGDGRTCRAGDCVDSLVDSATLPDYLESEVFGGGTALEGGGTCFDVQGCFATASPVTLDDACSFPAPAVGLDRLNVGLVPTPRRAGDLPDGVCDASGRCVVVLSGESPSGWQSENGRIRLPKAVCEKGLAVVATGACARKGEAVSPCGPWSSVTASGGIVDGDAGSVGVDGGVVDGAAVFAKGDGRPARFLTWDEAGSLVWMVGDELLSCAEAGCPGGTTSRFVPVPAATTLVRDSGALGVHGARQLAVRPEGAAAFSPFTPAFGGNVASLAVGAAHAAWTDGTALEYCVDVRACTPSVFTSPQVTSQLAMVPLGIVLAGATGLRFCDPSVGSDYPCTNPTAFHTSRGAPTDVRVDASNLYWLEPVQGGVEVRDYPLGNLPEPDQGQAWFSAPNIQLYAPVTPRVTGLGASRLVVVAGNELVVLEPPIGQAPNPVQRIGLSFASGVTATGLAATSDHVYVGLSNGDVLQYRLAGAPAVGGGGGGMADAGVTPPNADAGPF